MKKALLVSALIFMASAFCFANENPSTGETVKDWGIYTKAGDNNMLIDVGVSLTKTKASFSDLLTSGFDKVTKNATDEAKKMLSVLWEIPGVTNIRFSSYQIILNKARLVDWSEIEPKLDKAMSAWRKSVKK